jgi:Putative collagen-binding domain of a collagenase
VRAEVLSIPARTTFAIAAAFLCAAALAGRAGHTESAGPEIQPWQRNPWYWSDRGKPVLLVGGSDDDNLFQWPEADLVRQLDRLVAAGGNVIRNTMSDRKDRGFEVYPFARREDGRYDLERWNDGYWSRLERMLRETARRGVVVQIEIWDRFDYADNGGNERWRIHPYNPRNNVNYTFAQSGFAERYPDHPGANTQPFFFTTPRQRNNTVVLSYQQRFVDRLLDRTLRYGHVLYCIDNETSGEEEWSRYWAERVKARATQAGRRVYVTEMWDDWNLQAARHRRTFDHPALYDYVDVSQNNHNRGEAHWDNFLYVRNYLSTQPRPMNTTKTYGATGNKFGHTDQDGIERFWRHLLAGAASARFHRPDAGLGLNDKAVAAMRAVRKLESKVPLWSVRAANDLLSDRVANEAYLAADPGRAYVVYFPNGGDVTLDASATAGAMTASWIDIDTGEWGPMRELAARGRLALSTPGDGNWVVALVAGG